MAKHLKKTRGVMNLLIKEECIKALDCLADDDKMDELAKNFSMDDDYVSHANYEIARKWCYDQLKQCIDEHFSNPPLKFEELKEGMWVWDNKRKVKLLIAYCYSEDDMGYYNLSNPEDYKYVHIEFEENRFYRKQVEK